MALLLTEGGWEQKQQQLHLDDCQASGIHLRLMQGSGLSSVHTRQQPAAPGTHWESHPPGSTSKRSRASSRDSSLVRHLDGATFVSFEAYPGGSNEQAIWRTKDLKYSPG